MAARKKDFKDAGVSAFLSDTPEQMPTESVVKNIKINPVFQELIPALSEEERGQLEANLLENGIREPISLWGEIIIDGHNRYELAQKHGLTFTTVNYDFENENAVLFWIIRNQFGRRNLSAWTRSSLALKLKPVIAEQARENLATNTKQPYQNSDKAEKALDSADGVYENQEINTKQPYQNSDKAVHTLKELAQIAGVSHDTINRVEKIIDLGTPEIIESLDRGDVSINQAYKNVRLQEKKGEADASAVHPPSFSNLPSRYSVIYADCPWESESTENESKSSATPYYSMSIDELKKLDIPAADDAVLFMWSTSPLLEKCLQVMKAWGFKYASNMIWDKQLVSTGQWVRGQHEILLIGVKGNLSPPAEDMRISSVYKEKRGKHTVKPAYFYEQIERMFPDQKYLELFAHKKHSDLWDIGGNQMQSLESEGEE